MCLLTPPEDELLLDQPMLPPRFCKKQEKLETSMVEFHEAFGQILSNLRVLEDPKYSEGLLGWKGVYAVNMDKFNLWGGLYPLATHLVLPDVFDFSQSTY